MTQTPYQTGYKDRRIYCQQGPERLLPERTGLLSGLNFVFKDLFDVAGFTTGAGNPTWLKTHPPATHTSPLITQLLQAGATCLGRVQTDELAYSLNGQNCHYGTPVNPLAPDCLPGGSSSGSAVAVAQGDVDFSIGTDTGGSVRIPASYCGLYGLRPTVDQLDLTHCFELAKSFDTAGIFAREIGVLQQVYPVLTTVTDTQNNMPVKHFYYDRSLIKTMSDARMAAVRQLCQQADITLIERDFFTETTWDLTTLSSLFRTIQGYEIIQQHRAWLDEYGQTLDSAIFERVEWARTVTSKAYQQGLTEQAKFCEAVHAYLDDAYLDDEPSPVQGIWLLPTTPAGPPQLDLSAADFAQYRIDLMGLTAIAGLTGRPQLHIPIAGLAEGPCGFSLLGGAGQESVLIDLAQQLVNQETLS